MTLLFSTLLVGCSFNDIMWLRMSRNEVSPTAIDVSWKSQDAGPSWVAFGETEDYTHITPIKDDGTDEHAFTLVGLPPGTDVHLRAYTELADGTIASSWDRVYTSGSLTPMVRAGTVTVHEPDQVRDGVMFISHVGERGSLQLIDREGGVLWYLPTEQGYSSPGFAPSGEGGAFAFNVLNEDHSIDDGAIYVVGLDGRVQQQVAVSGIHHTFGMHPDLGVASFSTEVRDVPTFGNVAGDRLLALDTNDELRELFNSWDHLEVEVGDEWDSGFFPGSYDWTHMNGATWHPERNSWLLSLNGPEDLIEVDGDSGEVLDLFSLNDARYDPNASSITDPHGPDWTLDGDLLIFGGDDRESWCSAYDVSQPGVLKETWSHGRGEGLFGMALGEARQLTDGNILCNFGTAGVVRELTPQGQLVWEYVAPEGISLGQTRWSPDPYTGLWLDGLRR